MKTLRKAHKKKYKDDNNSTAGPLDIGELETPCEKTVPIAALRYWAVSKSPTQKAESCGSSVVSDWTDAKSEESKEDVRERVPFNVRDNLKEYVNRNARLMHSRHDPTISKYIPTSNTMNFANTFTMKYGPPVQQVVPAIVPDVYMPQVYAPIPVQYIDSRSNLMNHYLSNYQMYTSDVKCAEHNHSCNFQQSLENAIKNVLGPYLGNESKKTIERCNEDKANENDVSYLSSGLYLTDASVDPRSANISEVNSPTKPSGNESPVISTANSVQLPEVPGLYHTEVPQDLHNVLQRTGRLSSSIGNPPFHLTAAEDSTAQEYLPNGTTGIYSRGEGSYSDAISVGIGEKTPQGNIDLAEGNRESSSRQEKVICPEVEIGASNLSKLPRMGSSDNHFDILNDMSLFDSGMSEVNVEPILFDLNRLSKDLDMQPNPIYDNEPSIKRCDQENELLDSSGIFKDYNLSGTTISTSDYIDTTSRNYYTQYDSADSYSKLSSGYTQSLITDFNENLNRSNAHNRPQNLQCMHNNCKVNNSPQRNNTSSAGGCVFDDHILKRVENIEEVLKRLEFALGQRRTVRYAEDRNLLDDSTHRVNSSVRYTNTPASSYAPSEYTEVDSLSSARFGKEFKPSHFTGTSSYLNEAPMDCIRRKPPFVSTNDLQGAQSNAGDDTSDKDVDVLNGRSFYPASVSSICTVPSSHPSSRKSPLNTGNPGDYNSDNEVGLPLRFPYTISGSADVKKKLSKRGDNKPRREDSPPSLRFKDLHSTEREANVSDSKSVAPGDTNILDPSNTSLAGLEGVSPVELVEGYKAASKIKNVLHVKSFGALFPAFKAFLNNRMN